MNDPAASSGVSSSLLCRHSVLDTESSRAVWIPATAGMTNSRQAAGNAPEGIKMLSEFKDYPLLNLSYHAHRMKTGTQVYRTPLRPVSYQFSRIF